jgi:putative phosphoribosyl transferase
MWNERSETTFRNRVDGGRKLAERLERYRDQRPVVLALPRGGVVVGYEVAAALGAPLDVVVARKVGAPGNPEYAIGAIAPGVTVLNSNVVAELGVPLDYIEGTLARETVEMERRERTYRGGRPMEPVASRTVIVVDDGLATGATAAAALESLRKLGPARLVFAAPVVAPGSATALRGRADEVVWVLAPAAFHAVGEFYDDFRATTDEEVIALLERSRA